MTDPRRRDDDLVSAVLDGEATAEERARVEGDPVLVERLAEFRAVARRVRGSVGPVDEVVRDRAIARALDEADAAAEGDAVGIGPARERRRLDVSRRVVLAAAAVVGVLALAGGLLALDDGDESQDQAAGTAADDAGTAAGEIGIPELELGAVDDPETLRLRITQDTGLTTQGSADAEAFAEDDFGAGEAAPSADTTPEEPSRAEGGAAPRALEDCAIELVESRPQLIGQLAQGTVTYQGTVAYVFAYNDADLAGAVGIVTSQADCTVLAEIPL